MSDDVFVLKLYKNYSLDLINYTIYFIIVCMIFGNLSICLSKVSSSGLLYTFLNMINNDIIEKVLQPKKDTDGKTIYNPYYSVNRIERLRQIFDKFCIFSGDGIDDEIVSLNLSNETIHNLVTKGSDTKIQFDLVINHTENTFYLVYYKFDETYILNFLKWVYSVFRNESNLYVFFCQSFLQFVIFSLLMTQCYLLILYTISKFCSEQGILLLFAVPNLLITFSYLIAGSIVLCFMSYFTFYLFYNGYMLSTDLWNKFNAACQESTRVYNEAVENKDRTYLNVAIWPSWFYSATKNMLYTFALIAAFGMCLWIYFLLSVIYCACSLFGVVGYGLLYTCIMSIKGFFVDDCDPPCNTKSLNYTFKGDDNFTTYASVAYTYLKYTLTYYLLYVVFTVFPTTLNIFGKNVIVPFLIFATIGYYFIFKSINKFKEGLIDYSQTIPRRGMVPGGVAIDENEKAVSEMNSNPNKGNAIFSYIMSGTPISKTE